MDLRDMMRKGDQRFVHVSQHKVTKFLRAQGCEQWRVGSLRGWRVPPLAQARADWEKIYGKWDWPNDNEDWNTYPKSVM
jgi:hypothetical protein